MFEELFEQIVKQCVEVGLVEDKHLCRRGGGKVESVLCFPSAASFPRPSSGRWLQRLMSVLFAAGQRSPGHASQLVRDRDHDFVAWGTLSQPMHPLPESCCVLLHAKQYRAGTVDQHATEINVAALADAEQLLLAPGGVLPWHHANPGREVTSPAKSSSVADGGHGCGGDQRAEAGNLAQPPATRNHRY